MCYQVRGSQTRQKYNDILKTIEQWYEAGPPDQLLAKVAMKRVNYSILKTISVFNIICTLSKIPKMDLDLAVGPHVGGIPLTEVSSNIPGTNENLKNRKRFDVREIGIVHVFPLLSGPKVTTFDKYLVSHIFNSLLAK